MLILDKLWNGEVYPAERSMGQKPEFGRLVREVEQTRLVLLKTLGPEQQGMFQTFQDRMRDLAAFQEKDAFFAGICLGGQLLIDLLAENI